jgi:Bacterial SH3 domain
MNKFKIIAKEGLNLRTQPTSASSKVGRLPYGVLIDVVEFVDGQSIQGNTKWAKITLEIEWGNVVVDIKYAYLSTYYLRDETLPDPAPEPPPVKPGETIIGKHPALQTLTKGQRFGLHVFNRTDVAKIRMKQGCKLFTVMDNVDGMRELVHMGASTAYRRHHKGVIEPWRHLQLMQLSKEDRTLILGRNEQDMDPPHFAGDMGGHMDRITWQAEWDYQFCQAVWANHPNSLPVVPNNAMGNPPMIENDTVGRHWAEKYKWLSDNAHRAVMGYHMYDKKWHPEAPSGGQNRPLDLPVWYSMRPWEFLKKKGYLAKNVVLFGDECFIDFENGGGSNWAGYGNKPGWTKKWFSEAGIFNQDDCYGATGFQALDGPERREWEGYSMIPVMGEMQEIWQIK